MKWQLFITGLKQSFSEILSDFISLAASLVTILVAYYHKRDLNLSNFTDWLVIVVILLAVYMFSYRCYRILWKWEMLVLPKNVFFKYVAHQASKAGNEIINIAGDLSWLESQKDIYISLVKNQTLHIVIYYSIDRVANNEKTKSIIKEYKQHNVQMIPYPSEIQPGHVKGMLIDKDENAKFLSFTKVNDGESIRCTKYYYDTNEYYMATAFINCIEKYLELKKQYQDLCEKNKKKIFIGIFGINNIGKSSLCLELKLKFGDDVAIIEDSFIGEAKKSTFEVALFCLLNQILNYRRIKDEQADKTFFIFDRTPIDNFAFLIHYKSSNEYDRYIEHLKNEIKNFMDSFDVIVLLYPEKGYRLKNTSFLNIDVRKRLPHNIIELYREIYSDKVIKYRIKKYSKEKEFRKRIKEIVDEITQKHIGKNE